MKRLFLRPICTERRSPNSWCRVCGGKGKFVFLRLDIPGFIFEEVNHFGCRGTGYSERIEFTDIPHINPSTEREPIRGALWANGKRTKADSISGEIYQLPPVEDEGAVLPAFAAE